MKNAVTNLINHLDGMTQATVTPDGVWGYTATLRVLDSQVRIDIEASQLHGEESRADILDADTDDIERAIVAAIDGCPSDIEVVWEKDHARLIVEVAEHTTPRDGDEGGWHVVASVGYSAIPNGAVTVMEHDRDAVVDLAALIGRARRGESVTGHDDDDDAREGEARAAVLRLAARLKL